MSVRDAANTGLDIQIDALSLGAFSSAELFAVVDLVEGQPVLRRSLSDPSASVADRAGLLRRLLHDKVSAATMTVLETVIQAPASSGHAMLAALERQAVRLTLRAAKSDAVLERVMQELHTLSRAVDESPDLFAALRHQGVSLEGKRELIDSLVKDKAHQFTRELASRAVAARKRTFPLTIRTYLTMAAELAGKKIARIVVACPLDETRLARLQRALEQQTGSPVVLHVEVDSSVLGGISVHIDDHVIESTVAARLEDARRQLINL